MRLKIASDHPLFLLKAKVQEASSALFETFGFSYFQYLRCFADGSISVLTNHTGLMECIEQFDDEPVVFSSFAEEYEQSHSYWFLWDEELPDMPVRLAREQFNFHNGLTLVRRNKHYYDMIAVALPYEHPNPGSFYLNKYKAFTRCFI